jgi:hypothetical protein
MPKGILFWVLMLLTLIFGVFWNYRVPAGQQPNYGVLGMNLLNWVLLALLGWAVFGFAIQ